MPIPSSINRPLLVGEQNPYGGDDEFALYPAPDGCSGHRLCCKILGMRRVDYLESFERTNLCIGEWNPQQARFRAHELSARYSLVILLGSKVSAAFSLPFNRFSIFHADSTALILPHPSGRNLIWNDPQSVQRARKLIIDLAPHLEPLIGRVDVCRPSVA